VRHAENADTAVTRKNKNQECFARNFCMTIRVKAGKLDKALGLAGLHPARDMI
jgi:hypothetical protein